MPDDIYWDAEFGMYLGGHENRLEWDARLDTFTRCQETMAPVFSLIEEMVRELDSCYCSLDGFGCGADYFIIDRANKLLVEMK